MHLIRDLILFSRRGSVLFHFFKKKEIIKRFPLSPSFLESPCLGDFLPLCKEKLGLLSSPPPGGTYSKDLATATGGGVSASLIRIQLIEQMKWCGKENRKRQNAPSVPREAGPVLSAGLMEVRTASLNVERTAATSHHHPKTHRTHPDFTHIKRW